MADGTNIVFQRDVYGVDLIRTLKQINHRYFGDHLIVEIRQQPGGQHVVRLREPGRDTGDSAIGIEHVDPRHIHTSAMGLVENWLDAQISNLLGTLLGPASLWHDTTGEDDACAPRENPYPTLASYLQRPYLQRGKAVPDPVKAILNDYAPFVPKPLLGELA